MQPPLRSAKQSTAPEEVQHNSVMQLPVRRDPPEDDDHCHLRQFDTARCGFPLRFRFFGQHFLEFFWQV